MNVPTDLHYTPTHEWLRLEGDIVEVGITDHAQCELGDIVFVDLPDVGRMVNAGISLGAIEAVKTVTDLFAPCAGEIVAVNTILATDASTINRDPYGAGWIVRLRPSTELPEGLLDAEAYRATL